VQNNVTSRRERVKFCFSSYSLDSIEYKQQRTYTKGIFCVLFSKEMHDARQDNGSAASSASFTHTQRTPKESFVYFRIKETRQTDRGGYRMCYTFCTHTRPPGRRRRRRRRRRTCLCLCPTSLREQCARPR